MSRNDRRRLNDDDDSGFDCHFETARRWFKSKN